MYRFLMATTLLFTSAVFAYPKELKVADGDKYNVVKIREFEDIHFSENCFKSKKPNCDAYNASKIKTESSISKTGTAGNPGARYCHDKGASVRILIAEDKKQYDFCLFKDRSMVDAWELYYKHFPK